MMNRSNSSILNNCFVNIGTGIYQEHILKTLRHNNIFTISTDINPQARSLRYADTKIICSSSEYKKIYSNILKIKKRKKLKIIGVITGCTRGAMFTSSYIANKFKLEKLNLKTTRLICNKKLFLKKNNKSLFIKKSRFSYLKTNDFPIILKDDRFSGASGIEIINNVNQLKKKKIDNNYVIEKFVKAKHIIVTGLVIKSKVSFYTIIEKKINKNFTTKKLIFPSKLSKLEKERINKFVKKKLNSINFNHGPFSFEIFFTINNIYCAEIESSIPGSFINEFILKKCLNINLVDLIIKNNKAEKLEFNNKLQGSMKIEFFYKNDFSMKNLKNKIYSGYKVLYKKINKEDLKNNKKCLYSLIYYKKI